MAGLFEVFPSTSFAGIKAHAKLNPGIVAKIRVLAKKLRNTSVIHINATSEGGGVAELLKSQVAFEQSLGMHSRWFVMRAPQRFFEITKKLHNMLQGHSARLSGEEQALYFAITDECGQDIAELTTSNKGAIVMVHDPQPLGLIRYISPSCVPILRLHIDLLTPDPRAMEFAAPYVLSYGRVIISNGAYRMAIAPWIHGVTFHVIAPAIDPLSEKNRPMKLETAVQILEQCNINCAKPIVAQVSRFDSWKDPLGVIEGYYHAKNDIPDLQLVLEGVLLAKDDPEAMEVFKKVKRHAHGDPDIHLLSDSTQLNGVPMDLFVSALYSVSTVVVQKSIREGFGLTVTEAMWKGKPVVAGITTGTKMQIKNGKNGILISTPRELARSIVELIQNQPLRERIAGAAQKSVRKNFLISRYIYEHLKVYHAALF